MTCCPLVVGHQTGSRIVITDDIRCYNNPLVRDSSSTNIVYWTSYDVHHQ